MGQNLVISLDNNNKVIKIRNLTDVIYLMIEMFIYLFFVADERNRRHSSNKRMKERRPWRTWSTFRLILTGKTINISKPFIYVLCKSEKLLWQFASRCKIHTNNVFCEASRLNTHLSLWNVNKFTKENIRLKALHQSINDSKYSLNNSWEAEIHRPNKRFFFFYHCWSLW